MTLLASQAEAILDAATRSDLGIVVHIPDATAFHAKQVLYRFRKELASGAFAHLQIWLSPDDPDHRLWIINRPTAVPQHEPERTDEPAAFEVEF